MRRIHRRDLLALSAAGMLGVAGCSNSGRENSETGTNDGDDDNQGDELRRDESTAQNSEEENVDSATETWRFETGDVVTSSPAVANGSVYVGSHDGNVYALSASDGTEQWRFETIREVQGSPVVENGTVYVSSLDDHVYALSASDGTEIWGFNTRGDPDSTPVVVNDTLYVSSDFRPSTRSTSQMERKRGHSTRKTISSRRQS